MCGIVGCALSSNSNNNNNNASDSSSSSSSTSTIDNVAPILLESLTTLQHRGQGLFIYFY